MKYNLPSKLPSWVAASATLAVSALSYGQSVSLTPIAKVGAPLDAGANYANVTEAHVSPGGKAIVRSFLSGAAATNLTIAAGTPGALASVLRKNDMPPDSLGAAVIDVEALAIGNTGTAAARGYFPASVNGVWTNVPGALTTRVASGFMDSGGDPYHFAALQHYSSNDLAQLAFITRLNIAGLPMTLNVDTSGASVRVTKPGLPVPGQAGVNYSTLSPTAPNVLSNTGSLIFQTGVAGPGHPYGTATLLRDPGTGNCATILRHIDPAPSLPAHVVLLPIVAINMNDSNSIFYRAPLYGTGPTVPPTQDDAIFLRTSGGAVHTLIAREGNAAPDTTGLPLALGECYGTLDELFIANNDKTAFAGTLKVGVNGVTTANDRCIWKDESGTGAAVRLIAREGVTVLSAAPCGMAPIISTIRTIQSMQMNLNGDIVIQATLNDAASTPGIWMYSGGSFSLVLAKGDQVLDENQVPRLVSNVTISKRNPFATLTGGGPVGRLRAFNESGQVALLVAHSGGSGAYFVGKAPALKPIAVGLQEAAEIPGAQWNNIKPGAVINSTDDTAFRATLLIGTGGVTAANDTGIWAEDGVDLPQADMLQLIAREGDPAPGAPVGAVFADLEQNPVYNDYRTVAFQAQMLTGGGLVTPGPGGITYYERFGLWKGPATGAQTLVARSGAPSLGGTTLNGLAAPSADAAILTFIFPPAINNSDNIATRVRLRTGFYPASNTNITSYDDTAVVRFSGATNMVIAREGDTVSGEIIGNFDTQEKVFFNDNGTILVHGENRAHTSMIFHYNGALSVLAKAGVADATLGGMTTDVGQPCLAEGNNIVYNAKTATGGYVLYHRIGTGAAMAQVATHTAQSMGTYGPVGIDPAAEFSFIGNPSVSDDGFIAFYAELKIGVGGVTTQNKRSIWRKTVGGALQLIAREGSPSRDAAGALVPLYPFSSLLEPSVGLRGRVAFVGDGFYRGLYLFTDGDPLCPGTAGTTRLIHQYNTISIPTAPSPAQRNVQINDIYYGLSYSFYPSDFAYPSQQWTYGDRKGVVVMDFLDMTQTSGVFTITAP
jgi:hypothetical protein